MVSENVFAQTLAMGLAALVQLVRTFCQVITCKSQAGHQRSFTVACALQESDHHLDVSVLCSSTDM